MATVAISMSLICTVKQETRGRWVAGCSQLDLFSQGKTKEEAKCSLQEAIEIWVDDCLERGTLDQALREVGFRRVHPKSIQPGDEHIAVIPIQDHGEETADTFNIHLSIPAYQTAALLAQA